MNDDSLSDTSEVIPAHLRSLGATILPFKAATPAPVTPGVTPSDPGTPNPAVVKLFEDFLKAAAAGKLQFAAIATVASDGVAYSTWEPDVEGNPQLLTKALGAVSYLNHRFNTAVVQGEILDDETIVS